MLDFFIKFVVVRNMFSLRKQERVMNEIEKKIESCSFYNPSIDNKKNRFARAQRASSGVKMRFLGIEWFDMGL